MLLYINYKNARKGKSWVNNYTKIDIQNCSHFISFSHTEPKTGKDVGYLSGCFCNTIMYGKNIKDLIMNSWGIEEDLKRKSILLNFNYKQHICLYETP